jgi:hypothetical protein
LRFAIYGPLPPPHSGVEGMTQLLLDRLDATGADLEYVHVSNSVSRSNLERGSFGWHKLVPLAGQALRGAVQAARGYDAYYPIRQNTPGLARDEVTASPDARSPSTSTGRRSTTRCPGSRAPWPGSSAVSSPAPRPPASS